MLVFSVLCVKGVYHVHRLGQHRDGNIHRHGSKLKLLRASQKDMEDRFGINEVWLINRTGQSLEVQTKTEDEAEEQVFKPIIVGEVDQEKIHERDKLVDTLNELKAKIAALRVSDNDLISKIDALKKKIAHLNKEKVRLEKENNSSNAIFFQYRRRLTSKLLSGYRENTALREILGQLAEHQSSLDSLLQEQEVLQAQINDFAGQIDAVNITLATLNSELMKEENERIKAASENEAKRLRLEREAAERRAIQEELSRLNSASIDHIIQTLKNNHGVAAIQYKIQLILSFERYVNEKHEKFSRHKDVFLAYVEKMHNLYSFMEGLDIHAEHFDITNHDVFEGIDWKVSLKNGQYDASATFKKFLKNNQSRTIMEMHCILDELLTKMIDLNVIPLINMMQEMYKSMLQLDENLDL